MGFQHRQHLWPPSGLTEPGKRGCGSSLEEQFARRRKRREKQGEGEQRARREEVWKTGQTEKRRGEEVRTRIKITSEVREREKNP